MAYRYKEYEQSETVKKAREELEKQEGTKPGAYASRWQGWLDDTIGKILNREEFSYDMNADALYNQYRDRYVREGKLAMQDTMGQAAALTGGYGSSYAQQVGQQTYGSYLTALNDKLPELYRLALSRYQQAGSELNDRYQLLRQQEQDDYGRHQDLVSAWQADRTYLAGRYDREQSRDYDRYTGDRTLDYDVWLAAAKRAGLYPALSGAGDGELDGNGDGCAGDLPLPGGSGEGLSGAADGAGQFRFRGGAGSAPPGGLCAAGL